MMKYSDEFIEETLKENVELRMQYFQYKQKVKDYKEHYYNYRHQLSKEARNKNKEQVLRERDILQDRLNLAIEYIDTKFCWSHNTIEMANQEVELHLDTLIDILKGDEE